MPRLRKIQFGLADFPFSIEILIFMQPCDIDNFSHILQKLDILIALKSSADKPRSHEEILPLEILKLPQMTSRHILFHKIDEGKLLGIVIEHNIVSMFFAG